MGNAQITQLSRAIAVGAEKGIFSLPKGCNFSWLCDSLGLVYVGPSGRVKLAPKTPKVADDTKEVGVDGLEPLAYSNFIIPEQARLKDFEDQYHPGKDTRKACC
jgi:hypothetical protein